MYITAKRKTISGQKIFLRDIECLERKAAKWYIFPIENSSFVETISHHSFLIFRVINMLSHEVDTDTHTIHATDDDRYEADFVNRAKWNIILIVSHSLSCYITTCTEKYLWGNNNNQRIESDEWVWSELTIELIRRIIIWRRFSLVTFTRCHSSCCQDEAIKRQLIGNWLIVPPEKEERINADDFDKITCWIENNIFPAFFQLLSGLSCGAEIREEAQFLHKSLI